MPLVVAWPVDTTYPTVPKTIMGIATSGRIIASILVSMLRSRNHPRPVEVIIRSTFNLARIQALLPRATPFVFTSFWRSPSFAKVHNLLPFDERGKETELSNTGQKAIGVDTIFDAVAPK